MAVTKPKTRKLHAKNSGSSLLKTAYRHLTDRLLPRSTKPKPAASVSASLQALTAAALSLPGLMPSPVHAAEEEASFLYGYYQESDRNLFGVKSRFDPITVNSLIGSSKIKLSDRVKFAFSYAQDIWSGATPIATAPLSFGGNKEGGVIAGATPFLQNNNVLFDKQFNPLIQDASTGKLVKDTELVHTISAASPETRNQGDFKLSYEWDEAALDAGGGISVENDFNSHWGSLAGRMDFNQKQTSLNLGLSYTSSDINAILDHDATPYIFDTSRGFESFNNTSSSGQIKKEGGNNVLVGNRQDWGTALGLTQVLNQNALVEAGVGYTRSTGYMANPYKTVEAAFIDPLQIGDVLSGVAIGLLEKRPNERNQWTENLRYVQHIDALDAALHFDYRFFHDDWGINAHTFEADWVQPVGYGWTITPRVRYYSQDAANFYTPYIVSDQAFSKNVVDENGRPIFVSADNPNNGQVYFRDEFFNLVDADGKLVDEVAVNPVPKTVPFDRNKLPANYSSDHRLSGFGALSGGVTISKQFARGISFEASAEYYTHEGSLKLGGGGESSYADYSYYTVNGVLKVDLSALSMAGGGHIGHGGHHGSHAPAGVMFDHMLDKSGDLMVGTRYMRSTQGGNMLHGFDNVNDQTIVKNGCEGDPCFTTPSEMNMNMIMVELMYAPTDWLTLMLMPQFVDMNMSTRELNGAPPATFDQQALIEHHTLHEHTTGGIGDTGMYAMVKLFDVPHHHIHGTVGVTAPTGDVDIKFRDTHRLDAGFQHYGMQPGSGTWDFKPSITYTGKMDKFSWGAQLNGTVRLADNNESGFAFGDIFQSTAWGSYNLLDWLSASVRGVYTVQGSIRGEYNGTFNPLGPQDYPSNYGGRYWDVGFGLNAFVPTGDLQGNNLSFEWLQPVSDDVNGYQLPRDGALSATWSYAF
ncbi:MAG: DUF3570 domain-containing protein [Methylococcales bacterium]|nr:DUF3570 domain-containing protein [Methylococcales bacterium]